jgi:hypothetical protein
MASIAQCDNLIYPLSSYIDVPMWFLGLLEKFFSELKLPSFLSLLCHNGTYLLDLSWTSLPFYHTTSGYAYQEIKQTELVSNTKNWK